MPDPNQTTPKPIITQEELRYFARLTIQIEQLLDEWEKTRKSIQARLMHGETIQPGEINLDMLCLEAAQATDEDARNRARKKPA